MRRALISLSILTFITTTNLTAQSDQLLIRAERTQFRETSRYQDVMDFLSVVSRRSQKIQLTSFGYTLEGKSLPLAIVSREGLLDPAEIRASGRTIVYLQGNIHGGEVCGKEALLMLLRELVEGRHSHWLDSTVLLVAPIYNADGNDRILLTNRGRQNGPFGGMGRRPNAQNLDLNRDHMKLESSEARAVVGLFNRYDPHVLMDLHTTNGTRHAYHLTYSPPLNPNTAPEIAGLLRERWLPWLTDSIRNQYGWEFYYYGNVPGGRGGNRERGWYTFDHRPRFNNNYIGLRNRFAILSEAYSYSTFEDRILASLRFVRGNLEFTHRHSEEIRTVIDRVDSTSVIGTELAARASLARSAAPVKILMGEVETLRHPHTDRPILNRLDVTREESMYEFGTFTGSHRQRVPTAYLVPARMGSIVDLLRAHGIRTQTLGRQRSVSVQQFAISSSEEARREFQGHRERQVEGSYQLATLELAADTVVIPLNQPLARLIFYLLEPESDDGVLNWNMVDEQLVEGTYPILKTFEPIEPAGGSE